MTVHRRMTKQRRIILEEVRKVTCHPTADEVYAMVRKRLPQVSMGTVYRNLDRLSEEGELRKLQTSGASFRYDGNTAQHYHLRCLECGKVDDLGSFDAGIVEGQVQGRAGYDITGHNLEFTGTCPACQG